MGESNDLAEIHQNLNQAQPEFEAAPAEDLPAKHPDVVFYSPRRPYPYWTDVTTKHKSYKEAIQALAEKYERSPQWVQENMGNTNVLSEIHRNLNAGQSAQTIK